MPPAPESATPRALEIHSDGFAAKLRGAHDASFPSLPSNGKIAKEVDAKLDAAVDVDDRPCEQGMVDDGPASDREETIVDEIVIQELMELHEEEEPAREQMELENCELDEKAGDRSSDLAIGHAGWQAADEVSDENFSWTTASANTGWEIAESESVLDRGAPAGEKPADFKPAVAKEPYTYFMIRIPRPIDDAGKAEIRMAELRLKEKTEKRDFINAAFQTKKASRNEALDRLRASRDKSRVCYDAVRSKIKEMDPLQVALRKFRDSGRVARDRGRDLPASEHELDERIAYFEYRIEHESIPLKEEKQLLRDIKNLKACREEVCANEALQADFVGSLGERDEIQEQLKPLIAELAVLKAELTLATDKVKEDEVKLKEMDEALNQVQVQWAAANRVRQETFEELAALGRQESARNDEFYQNKREIQHVKQLALKKEKKMVEELCNGQVDRVMSLWNNNDEYRAAYLKANERSTLKRLQTLDGRAYDPSVDPPLVYGDAKAAVPDTRMEVRSSAPVTMGSKREESQLKTDSINQSNIAVRSNSGGQGKEDDPESSLSFEPDSSSRSSKTPDVFHDQVESDLVAAGLKEKRRQQEMAKAKEAEERKKRSVEKSRAKALVRAEKDAKKREKEKIKKAHKKASSLASGQGVSLATETETAEDLQEPPPTVEVDFQEIPPQSKSTVRQKRRPTSQRSKTVKNPLEYSLSKKGGSSPLPWFWISAGLIVLLGVALLARLL